MFKRKGLAGTEIEAVNKESNEFGNDMSDFGKDSSGMESFGGMESDGSYFGNDASSSDASGSGADCGCGSGDSAGASM